MTFVNVYWDGHELLASAKGEVFRLDARTGEVRWIRGVPAAVPSVSSP